MINIYSYKALINEYPTDKFTFNASPPFYLPDEDGLSPKGYYIVTGFGREFKDKITVSVERVKLIED